MISRKTCDETVADKEAERNRRAHELASERLLLLLTLSGFDGITFYREAVRGTNAEDRTLIREERSLEKKKIIAWLRDIECDPDYVVFEPYGA